MNFEKAFVECVQRGEMAEEVKKLSPREMMALGLAVRQLEEDQGVNHDVVSFDHDAIGNFIKARNENIRNY